MEPEHFRCRAGHCRALARDEFRAANSTTLPMNWTRKPIRSTARTPPRIRQPSPERRAARPGGYLAKLRTARILLQNLCLANDVLIVLGVNCFGHADLTPRCLPARIRVRHGPELARSCGHGSLSVPRAVRVKWRKSYVTNKSGGLFPEIARVRSSIPGNELVWIWLSRPPLTMLCLTESMESVMDRNVIIMVLLVVVIVAAAALLVIRRRRPRA